MIIHVLNGDALAERFPQHIEGGQIIIREAFMDGPLSVSYDDEYWETRAKYISQTYRAEEKEYAVKFLSQAQKMRDITAADSVYLWFEDDLFCQVNMWFAVHYIRQHARPKFYRILPEEDPALWTGFGREDREGLYRLFILNQPIPEADIRLIESLYHALVANDHEALSLLSTKEATTLRFLPEVVGAHLDRTPTATQPGRPQRILNEIIREGSDTFEKIFSAFSQRAGIYGYGDAQIRILLHEMGFEK